MLNIHYLGIYICITLIDRSLGMQLTKPIGLLFTIYTYTVYSIHTVYNFSYLSYTPSYIQSKGISFTLFWSSQTETMSVHTTLKSLLYYFCLSLYYFVILHLFRLFLFTKKDDGFTWRLKRSHERAFFPPTVQRLTCSTLLNI